MTLNEYQEKAWSTALPQCKNPNYMLLGLINEVGEIAGKVKKYLRNDMPESEFRDMLKKELGDAHWYLAGFEYTQGFEPEEICQVNLDKLQDRKNRGKLQGSGDNR